jgi:hypothetical protein
LRYHKQMERVTSQQVRAVLQQAHVRAVLKAAIFGLLLLYVQTADFSTFSITIFTLWSLYIFIAPIARRMRGPIAWLTLVCLALLMSSQFTVVTPQWAPHRVLPEHLFAIIFGLLAYVFLCVTGTIVRQSQRWYQVLHAGLIWGVSLLYITGQSGAHPIRATIVGALLLYALTSEYLRIHGQQNARLIRVTSVLIALEFVEIAWVLRLLPLSLGYIAAALALLVVVSTSASEQYMHGTLRGPFLRYAAMIVVIAAVVVAMSTRWIL